MKQKEANEREAGRVGASTTHHLPAPDDYLLSPVVASYCSDEPVVILKHAILLKLSQMTRHRLTSRSFVSRLFVPAAVRLGKECVLGLKNDRDKFAYHN